jgi:HEXXH motif-containing protein
MSAVPRWAFQFSLPQAEGDERAFDAVVGTHSQELVRSLLSIHGEKISSRSEGLVEAILEWCASPSTYEIGWDPAFGWAQLALTDEAPNPVETAVRIALRLTEAGVLNHAWRASIERTELQLGGLLLPKVVAITVEFADGTPQVATRAFNGRHTKCVPGGAEGDWLADGAERVPSVRLDRPVYLLGASTLPAMLDERNAFDGVDAVDSIDAATVARFRAALELFEGALGEYRRWIERVLRGVLVGRRVERVRVSSGSADTLPGVIHASYPAGVMDLGEIFVHECAHQYFYMLERVGPVDDGGDQTLYWSPPIRKKRPLPRILMAYHALANVQLFYRSIRSAGIEDGGYVDRYAPDMAEAVAQLDAPLRGNLSLTPLGRALYEPLAAALEREPARL